MKTVLIFFIRIYQKTLSRLLPECCRFYPTCSHYMVEAIQKKGVIRGVLKGTWRVMRCCPLCEGGYDPVDGLQTKNCREE